jgi:hypothetical protein
VSKSNAEFAEHAEAFSRILFCVSGDPLRENLRFSEGSNAEIAKHAENSKGSFSAIPAISAFGFKV